MPKPPTNTHPLTLLRLQLGMDELQAAEFIAKKTMRPCGKRTVQSWTNDPSKPSSRSCPEWAIELLQKEVQRRG